MVLVDVYVPSVDREYNFSLNENVSISTIIEEIVEMIGQKEQTKLAGNMRDICLISREKECILPDSSSLSECGIMTGALLILV